MISAGTPQENSLLTAATIAVTLPPVTAGSSIAVFGSCESAETMACADSVNGSYGAAVDDINDAGDGQRVTSFKFQNSAAGTPVVTITFSATTNFTGMFAVEVLGAAAASFDGHNGQVQATPTTGTDAVTSGTATPTAQPGLIVALSSNTSGAAAPAAGTGFTDHGSGWAQAGPARLESKRYTATSAIAGTFTAGSNSAHATLQMLFKEASSGGTVNTKTISDTLAVAESTPKTVYRNRKISDAISLLDVLTKVITGGGAINVKTISESIGIAEVMSRIVIRGRSIAESILITESGAYKEFVANLLDSIDETDQLTDSVTRNRSASDAVTITDVLSKSALRYRSTSDAITIIDQLTKLLTGGTIYSKSITDALTVVDQLLNFRKLQRAFTDSIAIIDLMTAVRTGLIIKSISESIAINDTQGAFALRQRLISEAIPAILDQLAKSVYRNRTSTDALTVIDAATDFVLRVRGISETLTANDSLGSAAIRQRAFLDFVTVFESALAQYFPYVPLGSLRDVRIMIGAEDAIRVGMDTDGVRLGSYQ